MTTTHGLIFLLVLICIPICLSSVDNTKKAIKDEETYLLNEYNRMNKNFKNLVNSNLKSVLRFLGNQSSQFNLSSTCRSNSLKLISGLRDLKIWAVNFLDASGKLSDGFLSGNFQMFGNFEQCLNSSVLKRNGAVDFRGQYCLITIQPYLPSEKLIPDMKERLTFVERLSHNLSDVMRLYLMKAELLRIKPDRLGVCVPSGCEYSDVKQLFAFAGKEVQMNFAVDYCDTEESLVYFNPLRITFICIYSFFVLLLLIGTVIDQYSRIKKVKFENIIIRCILCFSIATNFPKFMSAHETDKKLSCLNGIRVLSLFYIILSHHYLIKVESFMMKNIFITFFVWVKEFFFQIILNGVYTVDVFFFIGGFLNCYIRAKKNITHFSIPDTIMFFIHRLFRLYPVLISIFLLLVILNGRGPLTHDVEANFVTPCLTDWWRNLLFVNNLFKKDRLYECLTQTWYLCCDMQFFLLSLLTVPILFRKPKIGIFVNSAIIFSALLATAIRVYVNKMPPTIIFSKDISEENIEQFSNTFQSPVTHAASYFGGMLLGFYLSRKTDIKMSKLTQLIGWIVASTMFCTALFMTKRWNSGTPWTRLGSALYFSLSRPLYSWSAGWLIFCCVTGHGGVINYLLSLKLWIPLNRLCLTMYLLSPIMQIHFYGTFKTTMDTETSIEVWDYFGDICISFLVSLPFVFLFESPFIALEKIIFPRKEKTSEPNENEMKGKEITLNENGIKSDKDINSIKI